MKASAVTDATPATVPASKERPEVAATLLQRLNHALDTRESATTAGARSTPTPHKELRGFAHSEGYPADSHVDTRIHAGPAFGTFAPINTAASTEQASERTMQPALADELLTLLDRLSARVYVGEQRVLLTLECALPGAAAEIVRDGAHLIIRLHASNESAFRTLLTQRDALERTLKDHNLPHVAVELMPVGGVAHERRD